ncbi:hypothetical protein [Mycobacteroides abscessus]|uniref:hypothetical protein n=1 Tax=Mycobacteroides abscessus TaxID=36809 RepID=UPI000C25C22B|nr:hypothetical protein [Mycobacteroides abscessus]
MSEDHHLFITAAGASSHGLAEATLRALGTRESVISAAAYYTAATQLPGFGIPADADYHGYQSDFPGPAWVQAFALDDAYRSVAESDFSDSRPALSALSQATHLVRLVTAAGSKRLLNDAVGKLRQTYQVAWMDADGNLR